MTKHKSVLLLSDLISVRSTRVRERLTLDEVPEEDRSHIVRLAQGVERIIQDAQHNDGIVNKEDVKEVAKSVGILPHQVVSSIKQ
nr:hypothetical protein [Herpetosiphonaceae bacterium]